MSRRTVGLLLLATAAPWVSGCFAEWSAARVDTRRKIETARSATYKLPRNQVWSALYSLVVEGYEIARERESRGYLETSWKQDRDDVRSKVDAEVVGEETSRVVIKVVKQGRSRSSRYDPQTFKTVHGPWSDWSDVGRWEKKEDELYVKLWEALGGKLEESAVEALKMQKTEE